MIIFDAYGVKDQRALGSRVNDMSGDDKRKAERGG
jgi:hypothetical protein